jgi:midasin
MRDTGAGGLACEALALICQALTSVEAGQFAVVSFADEVKLLHPFGRPFTTDAGVRMLSRFTFAQKNTQMEALVRCVVRMLRLQRRQISSGDEQMQLALIVSDGRRAPAWGDPAQWIRRAAEDRILLCFVIIDSASSGDSILELKTVSYPDGKLTMTRWIDTFPFPYYIVLHELGSLPEVLSDALRQWFQMSRE